uniref:pyridoxal phosphate-dependent decarboxylase family protein n=1 Tax=Leucobacter soli TaxID=2812850 RepID=UPI001C402B30|nr:aminotransferase class I/II-fold pyridoxal phosphate-dependent enzyme [Leucobacter soli]
MQEQTVALDPELVDAIVERAQQLLPLGSLWAAEGGAARADSPADGGSDADAREALAELGRRLGEMYPYGDVRYIGQILKPPHPVAWAANAVTALINPNNHALDGGPATAHLEKEAVADLARMFGMPQHLGHLTSSGTIANLEALFVARELRPEGVVLSSEAAHYTHKRMCALLRMEHETVPQDEGGRMDVEALERRLEQGGVSLVVATLGTTSLGALDPVHRILELGRRYGVRVHVDAAYGGFHVLLAGDDPTVDPAPFRALPEADSIVVDPHKHGLQAFGCGSVLFADPSVGSLYLHDSPYTYFTSDELHLGEISLECSRPGAPAAAFWATTRVLELTSGGLGAQLRRSREAATRIAAGLAAGRSSRLVVEPELDIVCYYPAAERASEISRASDRAFDLLAERGWHVAKLTVDVDWLRRSGAGIEADAETVTVLRSCVMKPEHLGIVDEFVETVEEVFSGLV